MQDEPSKTGDESHDPRRLADEVRARMHGSGPGGTPDVRTEHQRGLDALCDIYREGEARGVAEGFGNVRRVGHVMGAEGGMLLAAAVRELLALGWCPSTGEGA
jgi:hypothetical protein